MTQALGHEKAIGGNAQGGMMVKATPASSFIMGKTEFLLQFLVIALDAPAHPGHGNEPFERGVRGQGRQDVFFRFLLPLGPLDEQPFLVAYGSPLVVTMRRPHPNRGKATGQCRVAALPPGGVA